MKPNLILIAGTGSGIGLHLAKTLLQKGHELLLLDLKLMEKPNPLVCIPESRGLLDKIAGTWPWIGEMFWADLEKNGEKAIQKLR